VGDIGATGGGHAGHHCGQVGAYSGGTVCGWGGVIVEWYGQRAVGGVFRGGATMTARGIDRHDMNTTTDNERARNMNQETAREHSSECWVCVDCYVLHVNGDVPTWKTDDELAFWVADIDRYSGRGRWFPGRLHGVDHCGEDHDGGEDDDAMGECETVTFGKGWCECCRSTLAGSRHAMTYVWQD